MEGCAKEGSAVSRLHDYGFGKVVRGFRTVNEAHEFLKGWNSLTSRELRLLYPEKIGVKGGNAPSEIKMLVALKIQQSGIEGVRELVLGGA